MKLRRATPPTNPAAADEVDEVDEIDDPPGLLDNPFRIRADEHRAEPAEPDGYPAEPAGRAEPAERAEPATPPLSAEPVDRDQAEVIDQAEAEAPASIDLRAEAPVSVAAGAPHRAPPPRPAAATPPAAAGEVVDTPVTEADQRDALDLTTVRSQGGVRSTGAGGAEPARGFLSAEPPRLGAESALVRLIATVGVIAIGTAVGAALVANQVEGWIVGLCVSLVCVILAAILWRSRRL